MLKFNLLLLFIFNCFSNVGISLYMPCKNIKSSDVKLNSLFSFESKFSFKEDTILVSQKKFRTVHKKTGCIIDITYPHVKIEAEKSVEALINSQIKKDFHLGEKSVWNTKCYDREYLRETFSHGLYYGKILNIAIKSSWFAPVAYETITRVSVIKYDLTTGKALSDGDIWKANLFKELRTVVDSVFRQKFDSLHYSSEVWLGYEELLGDIESGKSLKLPDHILTDNGVTLYYFYDHNSVIKAFIPIDGVKKYLKN